MAASNVKVVVRVRPFTQREIDLGSECAISMHGGKSTTIVAPQEAQDKGKQKEHTFHFDHSYWSFDKNDPDFVTNGDIFEDIGRDCLNNARQGFNCSIFAYGQTGAGKSFSMMGLPDDEGLIPRICAGLFETMEADKDPNHSYLLQVSYMEIYNERIRDLLDPGKNKSSEGLKIRSHPVTGPYVENLSMFAASNFDSVKQLIDLGNKARTVAATNMNDVSSRSHAIFTLSFSQMVKHPDSGKGSEKVSVINLVDLAGSERVSKTGATDERLKEGASINVSLSALGRVISALALASSKKNVFIPYRDSVLTWLLTQSLGGNAKTIMLAAISPSADNFEETLSTLRYADRAKLIVNRAVVNEDPQTKLVRELRAEIERLKAMVSGGASGPDSPLIRNDDDQREIISLRDQLAQSERIFADMSEDWNEKLRRSEQLLRDRTHMLETTGVAVKLDRRKPYLVNLNEDPMMSECLVYYLADGETHVGRSADAPDADASAPVIQLSGLNIQDRHCVLDSADGKVTLTPVGDAAVYRNGHQLTSATVLANGDRVLLGTNHMFRFSNPLEAAESSSAAAGADWTFAQREFAEAQSNVSELLGSVGDRAAVPQEDLKAQLVKLFKSTNEANAISQALHRNTVFEISLSTEVPLRAFDASGALSVRGGEPSVRVTHLGSQKSRIWTRSKFLERLGVMRDMWLTHMEQEGSGAAGQVVMSPDGGEDPFSNADEGGSARVLGVAHVYLQFVRFRAPFSRSVPVFDSAGAVQCHLSVTFSPCAADGSELTESSIVADGAAQLLDQPLAYRMRLASLNGMDESVAQGSSVFVRYVWLDQTTQSTERIEVISGSATLSHDCVFAESAVTEAFLARCSIDSLAFEVFVESPALPSSSSDASSSALKSSVQFDFTVQSDVCELSYDGAWSPTAVDYSTRSDAIQKVHHLRHGQERRLVLQIAPGKSLTFDADDDAKAPRSAAAAASARIVPKQCLGLVLGPLRLVDAAAGTTDSGQQQQHDESNRLDMLVFEAEKIECVTSRNLLTVAVDWPASAHASRLLMRLTEEGALVGALVKLTLEFDVGESVVVNVEKEILLKVHLRDAEFLFRQQEPSTPITDDVSLLERDVDAEASALRKNLAWRFRISVQHQSPRKFMVSDRHEFAQRVISAYEVQLEALETVLLLEKYEQELALIRLLRPALPNEDDIGDEMDPDAKEESIRQLRTRHEALRSDPVVIPPQTEMRVSELSRTRSNTTTSYEAGDLVEVTHAELRRRIQRLADEKARTDAAHLKTRERLFFSNLLSIKLTLDKELESDFATNKLSAQELFAELMNAGLPEEYWSHWIQSKLDTPLAAQKRRVKSEPRIESSRIGGPPATPPPGGIVNSLMGMWRGASSSSIEFKSPQQQ